MFVDWAHDALAFAAEKTGKKMSGAALGRLLSAKLGRSIDRAAVSKMLMTHATKKTKPRRIAPDELLAISEITGYPLPPEFQVAAVMRVPVISWVQAGALTTPDAPLAREDLDHLSFTDLPEGEWIALKVEGDSMNEISPPGSTILVNVKDKALVSGACYVVADLETGAATYKQYLANPIRFQPLSSNRSHAAIFPDNEPVIIGRVRRTILDL